MSMSVKLWKKLDEHLIIFPARSKCSSIYNMLYIYIFFLNYVLVTCLFQVRFIANNFKESLLYRCDRHINALHGNGVGAAKI